MFVKLIFFFILIKLSSSHLRLHKSKVKYIFKFYLNITRKFLKNNHLANNTMMRVLSSAEKLEFVSKSVSWIQGQDIMETCFILNFGYEPPHNWPQV